jgi:hypothetical protein
VSGLTRHRLGLPFLILKVLDADVSFPVGQQDQLLNFAPKVKMITKKKLGKKG